MKEYQVFKEKARQMRYNHVSLDDIAQSLNLPKTTIYYWIKDIEVSIKRKPASAASGEKTRERAAEKRQKAYEQGMQEYENLSKNPLFRDFIIIYICEGYKRNRNSVSVINTDPLLLKMSFDIMKVLTSKTPNFHLQLHMDNDADESVKFWEKTLNVKMTKIRITRRKTSLTNRKGRLSHGILAIRYNDTYFRSRIQSWIDCLKQEWNGQGGEI